MHAIAYCQRIVCYQGLGQCISSSHADVMDVKLMHQAITNLPSTGGEFLQM